MPPLRSDVRDTLAPDRNPFWNRGKRRLLIATRDGSVAGRVAAIIDDNYNTCRERRIGFFGFFECNNDREVAAALFDATAAYCRENGMTAVYGPANPSLSDEAGLLVDAFNSPPMIKMSYNPKYYADLVEDSGFTPVKDLHAYALDLTVELPEKLHRVMAKLKQKKGLVVRPARLSRLQQELAYIKEVYNDAWSDNWDYAPMSEDEIDQLARQLRPLIKPELCPLVFYNGEPAGISIGLPDYNQVLWRIKGRMFPFGWLKFLLHRNRITQGRLWALGVKRKFRNLGYDALLYYESFMGARRLGYTWGEVSWILEDNEAIIRPIKLLGGRRYKTYRVYQRQLS